MSCCCPTELFAHFRLRASRGKRPSFIPYHKPYIFAAGMELYPRIGSFDIKTWTNCRMGMMSWAVLILCYAAKQRQLYGAVADSMLVSVFLLELYIFKFFL